MPQVYVRDWGTPERQASVTVKVQVLDENDNAPDLQLLDSGGEVPEVWQLGLTRVNVSENLAKGQLVARAVARDMDAGENGTVSFGFDSGRWWSVLCWGVLCCVCCVVVC